LMVEEEVGIHPQQSVLGDPWGLRSFGVLQVTRQRAKVVELVVPQSGVFRPGLLPIRVVPALGRHLWLHSVVSWQLTHQSLELIEWSANRHSVMCSVGTADHLHRHS